MDDAPFAEDERRAKLLKPLTPRQRTLVALLGHGLSVVEVAVSMGIRVRTARYLTEEAAQRIPGTRPAKTRIVLWYNAAPSDRL